MTTIAYKRGIMACDSCWTDESKVQQTSMIKIKRLSSGALIGAAGDNDSRAVEALLDKVKTFDKLPTALALAETKTSFAGLLVFKNGEAVIIEVNPPEDDVTIYTANVFRANRGCAAVGTGRELAIGAMEAGRSAHEAVGIACKWDINSRLPVHSVPLAIKRKIT